MNTFSHKQDLNNSDMIENQSEPLPDTCYRNEHGEADEAAFNMIQKNPDLWHLGTVTDIETNADNSLTITCLSSKDNSTTSKKTYKTKIGEKITIGDEVVLRMEEENPKTIHWIFSQYDEWGIPYGKQIFSVLKKTLGRSDIYDLQNKTRERLKNTNKSTWWKRMFS